MLSRTQNCIVRCQQCKGKNAFTKGRAGNSQNGKMLQPVNFFPSSCQGICVLHLIVVCVCVGGREISRLQINRNHKARGGGEAITHPGKGTGEALFTCSAYVLYNFFESLAYFFPRKRNSYRYWKASNELLFVAVHGISAESSDDCEARWELWCSQF